MIFLAIDEMQSECRMQNEAREDISWFQPHSAFCILHSALCQEQDRREHEEERMRQAHLQAGQE